ncbi:unnamed protein product [Parajaminaea phylloscopi]
MPALLPRQVDTDRLPANPVSSDLWYQKNVHDSIQVFVLGLFFWELVVTLRFEFRLWKKEWKRPTTVLYSVNRYFALATMLINVVLNMQENLTMHDCNRLSPLLPIVDAIGYGLITPLVMMRTWAICAKDKVVGAVLASVYAVAIVISFYASFQYQGIPFSAIPGLGQFSGGCANDPRNAWPGIPFVLWAVIDILCFLLATGKILLLWRNSAIKTSLQKSLLVDGCQYIFVVMTVNVINIAFLYAQPLAIFLRPTLAGPAGLITVVAACRLFQNLKEWGPNNPLKIEEKPSTNMATDRHAALFKPSGLEHAIQSSNNGYGYGFGHGHGHSKHTSSDLPYAGPYTGHYIRDSQGVPVQIISPMMMTSGRSSMGSSYQHHHRQAHLDASHHIESLSGGPGSGDMSVSPFARRPSFFSESSHYGKDKESASACSVDGITPRTSPSISQGPTFTQEVEIVRH